MIDQNYLSRASNIKGPLDERYNFLTAREKWFYLAVRVTRSTLHLAVTASSDREILLSMLPQTVRLKVPKAM